MEITPICEESGMIFLKLERYHLFDIEGLLKNHSNKHWGEVPVPEFVLWNRQRVYIVEAKSSVPRKKTLSKKDKEEAKKEGYTICSIYEDYCTKLLSKYTTALIVLRPDVCDIVISQQKGTGNSVVEEPEKLKQLELHTLPSINLVLVLRGVPDELIVQVQLDLEKAFVRSIKPWQPNARIIVMNDKAAAEKHLIQMPT